ncbi:glycosyltransferase family 1 protein [Nocardioides litoris]|uniref:glycosyltransferase family 1 protein n=1 Tax=Nocardioides litoris TaxID=1926648 RepID=UPI001476860F|nr:glycosyltransferase family 1 protein [Nocardioides litoris]
MTSAVARPRTLTVASVPTGHVYVRHLDPADEAPSVVRLDDPPPRGVRRPAAGQWWPPAVLDAAWVEAHAHEVDLAHLHFGFDALDPADLRTWTEALRAHGVPLVQTVHDLRNPHHHDRAAHDAHLDVLVPSADALVTLTPGAAAEIRARWGREATVVPHPHVVPLDTMRRVQSMRGVRSLAHGERPFRVGLHLKSLRASMAPERVLPVLVEAVAALPGAVLQVNAHRDVLAPDGLRHDPALAAMVREHAEAGRLELHVHDYLSDEALFDYLAGLDVSVLPYRFGTHSGWLEACRDVGTTVVAPSCGYLGEQGPVLTYVHEEDTFDAASLAEAVRTAWTERPDLGATVEDRRHQRRAVAAAHEAVYRSVVGEGGA